MNTSPLYQSEASQAQSRRYCEVETLFGHSILVPLEDTIGNSITRHGIYDRKGVCMMNAALSQLHKPVVLDIGANIGNHTLAMSTVAEKIYSFEPQQEVFNVLRKNVENNGIDNVELFKVGLSTQKQQLDLYIPAAENLGAATLRTELRADNAIVETIELVRGDDLVNSLDLTRLDLIKVDVEGFEIKVLEGLSATIQKFAPIIFMEWDQDITRQEGARSDLFQRMLKGYSPRQVGSNYDRDLWPGSIPGRLRRVAYKAMHKRHWLLRGANLTDSYGNLVLVPEQRLQVLDAIGPQQL